MSFVKYMLAFCSSIVALFVEKLFSTFFIQPDSFIVLRSSFFLPRTRGPQTSTIMDPDVDRFAYHYAPPMVAIERDYWDRKQAVRSRKRNPYPDKQDEKAGTRSQPSSYRDKQDQQAATRFQRKDAQAHYERAKRLDDHYKLGLEFDDEHVAHRREQDTSSK